jgi:hypothetical protein
MFRNSLTLEELSSALGARVLEEMVLEPDMFVLWERP